MLRSKNLHNDGTFFHRYCDGVCRHLRCESVGECPHSSTGISLNRWAMNYIWSSGLCSFCRGFKATYWVGEFLHRSPGFRIQWILRFFFPPFHHHLCEQQRNLLQNLILDREIVIIELTCLRKQDHSSSCPFKLCQEELNWGGAYMKNICIKRRGQGQTWYQQTGDNLRPE